MKEELNIRLEKLIVHVLDANLQIPVLSENEHPLGSEVADYIEGHIQKILNDDGIKTAVFKDDDNAVLKCCREIADDKNTFSKKTADMAACLYDLMSHYPDIPSGDLICCLFTMDNVDCLGILKMNYRVSYTHALNSDDNGTLNLIVRQNNTLPGEGNKVDEAIIVNLNDFSLKILEKKFEINGEDRFYLSEMYLKTECEPSNRDKAKLFKKASESFSKKHFVDEIKTAQNLSKAITEGIEKNEIIDVDEVADTVFKEKPELKETFIEHIENSGLEDKKIQIDMEAAKRVFKKHKIKTEEGIEISIPYEFYRDRDKLEVLRNSDGTVSIIIKHINKITNV